MEKLAMHLHAPLSNADFRDEVLDCGGRRAADSDIRIHVAADDSDLDFHWESADSDRDAESDGGSVMPIEELLASGQSAQAFLKENRVDVAGLELILILMLPGSQFELHPLCTR